VQDVFHGQIEILKSPTDSGWPTKQPIHDIFLWEPVCLNFVCSG